MPIMSRVRVKKLSTPLSGSVALCVYLKFRPHSYAAIRIPTPFKNHRKPLTFLHSHPSAAACTNHYNGGNTQRVIRET